MDTGDGFKQASGDPDATRVGGGGVVMTTTAVASPPGPGGEGEEEEEEEEEKPPRSYSTENHWPGEGTATSRDPHTGTKRDLITKAKLLNTLLLWQSGNRSCYMGTDRAKCSIIRTYIHTSLINQQSQGLLE